MIASFASIIHELRNTVVLGERVTINPSILAAYKPVPLYDGYHTGELDVDPISSVDV